MPQALGLMLSVVQGTGAGVADNNIPGGEGTDRLQGRIVRSLTRELD